MDDADDPTQTVPDWNSLSDTPPASGGVSASPPAPPAPPPITVAGTPDPDVGATPAPDATATTPAAAPAPAPDPSVTPLTSDSEVPTAAQAAGVPDWNSLSAAPPPSPGIFDRDGTIDNVGGKISSALTTTGNVMASIPSELGIGDAPDAPGSEPGGTSPQIQAADANSIGENDTPLSKIFSANKAAHAGVATLSAMGSGAQDLANTVNSGIGLGLKALDNVGAKTSTYDWWNQNVQAPGEAQGKADWATTEDESTQGGALGAAGSVIGNVADQMAEMTLGGGEADGASIVADYGKTAFQTVKDVIADGLSNSARLSRVPAAVEASKTYKDVYDQTGDPEAAVKASLMSGGSMVLGNALPMAVEGPLMYRLISGGFLGATNSEMQRDLNNTALPDNMQQPFTWKGMATNAVAGSAMGGAFGAPEPENYQVAALRYNGIQDAAAKGNAGAQRTATIVNDLSNVDGLTNAAVDAAVHGVTLSNTKMGQTHPELMTNDPRYASIFNATQGGAAPVDPVKGEAIARDAYAREVSSNAAWSHYTTVTGQKSQALQMVANARDMMAQASSTVPPQELDILSRWASFEQPSQLQFNSALRHTVENKEAPDYVHDKYDGDYYPDGTPSEMAFHRDAVAAPVSYDAYYAPDPKVETALKDGGIRYYRMDDGRLAVRGGSSDYTTNVFAHVFDTTGEVPLKPGESYEPTSTADQSSGENGQAEPTKGSGNGSRPGQGDQAQGSGGNGQQDGDEGNGSGGGAGSQLGDEGVGTEQPQTNDLTPRAAPVAAGLEKAGVADTAASVTPRGEIRIDPTATPEEAGKALDVAASDTAATNTEYLPPTRDQARSGNYRKGGVLFKSPKGDVRVKLENPDGSIRKGQGWSRPLRGAHYGYIPDTISRDGEPLDVLMTRMAMDDKQPVAVISQHDPHTGAFDELKVVMGTGGRTDAMQVYGQQYPPGMLQKLLPHGKRDIVMMDRAKFSKFIKSGATDVPPHPVSGEPMLAQREHGMFVGDAGTADHAAMGAKVKAVNAKHDTAMDYDQANHVVVGKIPSAKADSIHRSLSRVEGYGKSAVDGEPLPHKEEAYTNEQEVKLRDKEKIEAEERKRAAKDFVGEHVNDESKKALADKPEDKTDSRLMFAGEKAKTAPVAELARAKSMEGSLQSFGANPAKTEDMLNHETGWTRAANGKWQFEISDQNSGLNPAMKDPKSPLSDTLRTATGAPLKDVLNHSSLFEAYPHIGDDIHVRIDKNLPTEYGAVYQPESKTVVMHAADTYPAQGDQSIHSILLHEVQHNIQYHEGFPEGGSPNDFMATMREQKVAMRAQRTKFEDQLDALNNSTFANGRDGVMTPEEEKQHDAIMGQIDRINDLMKRNSLGDYQSMMDKAKLQYHLLAGENQAYNTQDRLAMSDAQRREQSPSSTEKFPRADQIIKSNGGSDAAHMAEPSEPDEVELTARHLATNEHIAKIQKAWKGAPGIQALRSRSEAPEDVQHWLSQNLPDGVDPAGLYHNGKIYLFSGEMHSPAYTGKVILHEMVGHFGLRGTFGDQLNNFLDSVHGSVKDLPAYKDLHDQYRQSYSGRGADELNRSVTEEYLAKIAQDGSKPGVLAKFMAWIRQWGRDHGMVSKWSDADLKSVMSNVADDVREGRVSTASLESPDTQFDDDTHIATSTYAGAAGRGTIEQHYDGSRDLKVGSLEATLRPSVIDGEPVISVSDMVHGGPHDIALLSAFAHEEGRDGLAIGKDLVTKDDLKASGVPFKERPGYYHLEAKGNDIDQPMYSLRNRAKGSQDIEDILKKAIDHSTLNMTPWDRMQQSMRDFRDNIQHGDTALELKQSYVDALASIETRERQANGGLLLDAAESAYKSAWLAKNNEQITAGVMKVGVPEYKGGSFVSVAGRKGLLDALAPLYKTADGKVLDKLFEGYAMGHRSNELLHQFNHDGTPKEKLLTQPEVDKLMALDKQYPVFKTVLGDVKKFNDQLLDLAVDRGTMSKEVADNWKGNMYVPFYRSIGDSQSTAWRGSSKSLSGQKVRSKKIYGSDQKVEPIIENIVKNTSAILDKIYSNEAMRRVVAVSDGIGMERVKMPLQAIRMSAADCVAQLAKAGITVDTSNLTPADLDTLTTIFRPQKPIGPNIVSVVENGKNLYYRVTDPLLYRSVTAFNDLGQFDKVLNTLLGGTKRIYTVATTLDPRFMFRIMMKDAVQTWIQTGTNPNMFKGVMTNAKDIYSDSTFLNQLRVAGYNGNEYYKIHELRDQMQQLHGSKWTVLNSPKKIYDAYHKVGWLSEQLSRVNVAKHTLANGGSMAEAAWQGQNTLNWQKRGDGRAAQLIMRGAPFLNAHIQGLARIYDGALGRDVTMSRSRAVTSFMVKSLGIAAASLALAYHNQNNPDYERLPDEAKDLYWHVFVGDHHFVIPKPFEIGALTATLPERVMRAIDGTDNAKTFIGSVGRTFSEAFGLNPTPVAAMPIISDIANKDFTSGAPIVSEKLQGLEPAAQETPTTSQTVVGLAHAMPAFAPDAMRSPVRLQHLIQGYTSTLGMYLLQMSDAAVSATGHSAPAPANRFGSPITAGLARMTGYEQPSTDTRNKYIEQVYDAQKDADAAAKTFKAYIASGHLDEAREVMQNNKTALAYRGQITAMAKQMSELHKVELMVYQAPNMSPADKREKLDSINAMRTRYLDKMAPILDMVDDY